MNQMDYSTKKLCEEIQGCKFAYTQSDEISLLLTDFDKITTSAWFDGQVQKMVSVAASLATGYFNKHPHPYQGNKIAFFDARVFTIPDPIEVENYFVWRQKDAMRNAVSMVAQSMFSHKELQGKSQEDMKNMIQEKENIVSWDNDIPLGFKFGRSFYKAGGGTWSKCFSHFMDEMPGSTDQRVISQFIPKISYE